MKYATALAIALIAVAIPSYAVAGDVTVDTPATSGNYIVGFYSTPTVSVGDLYQGATVLAVDTDLNFITVEVANFQAFSLAAALDSNVRYVESDVSDHKLLYTPNDYFTNHAANYGYWKIGADVAHDKTLGTTAVKNGHVDSGLNFNHEEYAGQARVLAGKNFYSTKGGANDERGCNWHGTHSTGTAMATINNGKGFPGIAQGTIMPVKIFGGGFCMAASTTNIANALKYVGDQGSHVSSNSWGGGSYSTAINDAITYSVNKGVLFVAAAGNDGCTNCIGNPWKSQSANVVIVGATDSNDALASFSSQGPEVDISAPGVDIGSSTSGTADYHYMSGTSMATPYVTGVAALIKTLNPTMSASSITNRLTSTATDLGAAGKDDGFGHGRVNAAAAVY